MARNFVQLPEAGDSGGNANKTYSIPRSTNVNKTFSKPAANRMPAQRAGSNVSVNSNSSSSARPGAVRSTASALRNGAAPKPIAQSTPIRSQPQQAQIVVAPIENGISKQVYLSVYMLIFDSHDVSGI